MSDGTKIEWTEATWNPVTGCSLKSPGCTNCYAMRLAGTRLRNHASRIGLTREVNGNHVWTGAVRFNEQWLDQPLRWKRPRMIFVCAHGDLFHESVPDEWIDRVFSVMALCPQHTFQVLTKRSARMREWFASDGRTGDRAQAVAGQIEALGGMGYPTWPLPNVWLGVSVEDQQRADERIPDLLSTPAALRWLSCEPLLGRLQLDKISTWRFRGAEVLNAFTGELSGMFGEPAGRLPRIDWIVAGGESGPGARPMHPDWARSLRDQCAAASVPFFFKQWGAWVPEGFDGQENGPSVPWKAWLGDRWGEYAGGPVSDCVALVGKKRAGRLLDGQSHSAFPEMAA